MAIQANSPLISVGGVDSIGQQASHFVSIAEIHQSLYVWMILEDGVTNQNRPCIDWKFGGAKYFSSDTVGNMMFQLEEEHASYGIRS